MLFLVSVLISASLLGCTNSENDLRGGSCTGDIGTVQNPFFEVTETVISATFGPPIGFENCDMLYEVIYYNAWNNGYYRRTVDKNLRQSYNYFDGRVLCKKVNVRITPIYNGVRGQSYDTVQVTDKILTNIDIGPPRNIKVKLEGDSLYVNWVFPIDYDNCGMYYNIETISINGEVLHKETSNDFEYRYNYGLNGNYCKYVIVRVESAHRGVSGGALLASIQLGPPPNGSC